MSGRIGGDWLGRSTAAEERWVVGEAWRPCGRKAEKGMACTSISCILPLTGGSFGLPRRKAGW